ncbi:MAG: EamA family transporter [Armatimonadetes bacterium]|nr:EamA family transporter [Armatimonadota bacterium]
MTNVVPRSQVVVLVLVSVACVSLGEALLAAGMRAAGRAEPTGWRLAAIAAGDWRVWAGTALMAAFYGMYALALSWADLSFVLPITALSYLLGAILAATYLGEAVTATRWIGTALIVAGVVVVGKGG